MLFNQPTNMSIQNMHIIYLITGLIAALGLITKTYLLVPISFLFLIIVLIINHYDFKSKIKNGTYKKIGRNSEDKGFRLFGIFGGISFVIIGFSVGFVKIWKGIDLLSLIGLFSIINGLFNHEDHKVIIKPRTILLRNFPYYREWSYEIIESITVLNNKITVISKKGKFEQYLENQNDIREFKKSIQDKIEENRLYF